MFSSRAIHGVGPALTSVASRSGHEGTPPKLCDNGRAYVTDPSTGQLVCLCQLDAHASQSLSAHPALRGLHSLGGSNFTDLGYPSQIQNLASLGDQSTAVLPHHLAFHPYGGMYPGMDMNGPMRKAATRETTGPLKAWLSEHKKNPYPTKAEKIMLAIITRMTLTQVSTWFANARRRLKKDNRLTGEDDSIGLDSDREGDLDSVSMDIVVDNGRSASYRTEGKLSSEGEAEHDSFSDISDDENDLFGLTSREKIKLSPAARMASMTSSKSFNQSDVVVSSSRLATNQSNQDKPKPKIWSISQILES